MVPRAKGSMMLVVVPVVVVGCGELDINGAKKGEDDGLKQSDKKLHEVEGEWSQDAADLATHAAAIGFARGAKQSLAAPAHRPAQPIDAGARFGR